MTIDRSRIIDTMTGKMQPEDVELVAGILCRTPDEYRTVTVTNIIVSKSGILDAMAGKLPSEDTERIADILRQTSCEYQTVAVDGTVVSNTGPVRMIAPLRPEKPTNPYMIELPARLVNGPWLRHSLLERIGRQASNKFYACLYDLGRPAQEPVFLAAVLREVYGPDGLRALVDAAVFAQPSYSPFKPDVEPVLEEHIY